MLCVELADRESAMAEQLAEYLVSGNDFLQWESAQESKFELIANRVYPMTGASRPHNLITARLIALLINRLQAADCEIYPSDMRVQVDAAGTYTYPDVVVVCGEPRFRPYAAQDTLLNPALLIEVLSPSTELVDRNLKLRHYLQIPSLIGYLLVAQNKPLIQAHLRIDDDWRYRAWQGLDSSAVLEALGCELPLREIYRKVGLE